MSIQFYWTDSAGRHQSFRTDCPKIAEIFLYYRIDSLRFPDSINRKIAELFPNHGDFETFIVEKIQPVWTLTIEKDQLMIHASKEVRTMECATG